MEGVAMTPVPATSAHVPEDLVGVIVNEVGHLQIKKNHIVCLSILKKGRI